MFLTAMLCIYIDINVCVYIYTYLCANTFTFEINQIFLEDRPDCDAGYGHP